MLSRTSTLYNSTCEPDRQTIAFWKMTKRISLTCLPRALETVLSSWCPLSMRDRSICKNFIVVKNKFASSINESIAQNPIVVKNKLVSSIDKSIKTDTYHREPNQFQMKLKVLWTRPIMFCSLLHRFHFARSLFGGTPGWIYLLCTDTIKNRKSLMYTS